MGETPKNDLILVTGGWGYLGSCVTQLLLTAGYRVRVIDPSPLGGQIQKKMDGKERLLWLPMDLCHHDSEPDLLEGVHAVIHLGDIANTDACEAFPDHAVRINHHGTLSLARRARLSAVTRYIYVSTCSMYAESGERGVHELSPIEPKTLYTQLKAMTEVGLLALSEPTFGVTILRMASLFGLSLRMRFDVVANRMMKDAWRSRVITVHGSGKQMRPFLHVEDAARAILATLEKDPAITRAQIFNVGRDDLNYRICDLAADVSSFFLGTSIVSVPEVKDLRQYRVSFAKFAERIMPLTGRGMRDGLMEIAESLQGHRFTDPEEAPFASTTHYKSLPQFLYAPWYAARSPTWEPFLVPEREIPLKKPFLMDRSAAFRKKWPKKPRIIGVMVGTDVAGRLESWAKSLSRDVIDEVIFVDDGSRDGSASLAKNLGLKVLRHDMPQGYGASLKAGFRKALDREAEYVVELSDKAELFGLKALEASLPAMHQGIDVILGSRLLEPYRALVCGMPFVQYALHLMAGPLVSWGLGRMLTDLKPQVRIFSGLLLRHLPLERGPEDEIFPFRILLQAVHLGATWAEFPLRAPVRPPVSIISGEPAVLPPELPSAVGMRDILREIGTFLLAQWGVRSCRAFPLDKGRPKEHWTDQPPSETESHEATREAS